MKLSIFIRLALLLAIVSPNESAVYDFNVKTVAAPSDFSDELKLKADLDSEYNQGLMRVTLDATDENGGDASPADTTTIVAELKNAADPLMPSGDSDDATKQNRDVTEGPSSSTMGCFVGTNLFDGSRKKCFSSEDVALLAVRKDFESLIPKDLPQSLLNDKMVNVLMQYFCASNQIVQRMSDNASKRILEKAFYDTLGGYLRHYIVPVTKVSFYAGKVSLKTVQNVVALYHQCQLFLNTNGNGWRAPIADVLNELTNVRIEPLVVKLSKDDDQPSSCIQLDMTSMNNDAEDDQMIVSLPKLDPEDSDGFLGNIWLPFKRKRTYNLRSEKSSCILVKFYETVSRCYHFQSMCQNTYNQKFKAWILENIQVHLSDEQFYPGLGSILKIYENLRRGKKAITVIEDDAIGVEESADVSVKDDDKDAPSAATDEFDTEHLTALGAPKKRQKTNKFKNIEYKSKKIESKTDNWFNNFYENAKRERKVCEKPKTTCMPVVKPKCKPKPKVKPKCKPKGQEAAAPVKTKPTGKEKPAKPPPPAPKGKPPKPEKAKPPPKAKPEHKASGPLFSEAIKQRLLKLLHYILLFIVLVFVLLLLLACCKRVKRYIQSRPKKVKPDDASKKRSLCDLLCCKKKKTKSEETVLIKPTSKSVICGKVSATKISESTSSLFCHPKAKCLPLGKGKAKEAPVKKTSSTSVTSASSASSTGKKPKAQKGKEAKKPKEKEKKPKEKKVKIKSRKCVSPCKKRCCRSKERKKSPTSTSSASTTPRKSSLKPAKPLPKPTKTQPKVKPVSPKKAKPPTPPKRRSKCCSRTPTPPPEKKKFKCFSGTTSPFKSTPKGSPKVSPKGSPKTPPKSTPRRGRRRGCDMVGMQRNVMSSTEATMK